MEGLHGRGSKNSVMKQKKRGPEKWGFSEIKRANSSAWIHLINLRLKSDISGIFRTDIYSFVWRYPNFNRSCAPTGSTSFTNCGFRNGRFLASSNLQRPASKPTKFIFRPLMTSGPTSLVTLITCSSA